MQKLIAWARRVFGELEKNIWLPVLLARLAMAGEFVPSGWGKLNGLPKLTAYFVELGVPMPGVNAAATATTEFVGGLMILLGLGTRFAATALSVVMMVAIATTKLKEAHTLGDFFYASEPCYLVIFVWLVFQGGGKASLDHPIAGRLKNP